MVNSKIHLISWKIEVWKCHWGWMHKAVILAYYEAIWVSSSVSHLSTLSLCIAKKYSKNPVFHIPVCMVQQSTFLFYGMFEWTDLIMSRLFDGHCAPWKDKFTLSSPWVRGTKINQIFSSSTYARRKRLLSVTKIFAVNQYVCCIYIYMLLNGPMRLSLI